MRYICMIDDDHVCQNQEIFLLEVFMLNKIQNDVE
jgi:hypothetical protein